MVIKKAVTHQHKKEDFFFFQSLCYNQSQGQRRKKSSACLPFNVIQKSQYKSYFNLHERNKGRFFNAQYNSLGVCVTDVRYQIYLHHTMKTTTPSPFHHKLIDCAPLHKFRGLVYWLRAYSSAFGEETVFLKDKNLTNVKLV